MVVAKILELVAFEQLAFALGDFRFPVDITGKLDVVLETWIILLFAIGVEQCFGGVQL